MNKEDTFNTNLVKVDCVIIKLKVVDNLGQLHYVDDGGQFPGGGVCAPADFSLTPPPSPQFQPPPNRQVMAPHRQVMPPKQHGGPPLIRGKENSVCGIVQFHH